MMVLEKQQWTYIFSPEGRWKLAHLVFASLVPISCGLFIDKSRSEFENSEQGRVTVTTGTRPQLRNVLGDAATVADTKSWFQIKLHQDYNTTT